MAVIEATDGCDVSSTGATEILVSGGIGVAQPVVGDELADAEELGEEWGLPEPDELFTTTRGTIMAAIATRIPMMAPMPWTLAHHDFECQG